MLRAEDAQQEEVMSMSDIVERLRHWNRNGVPTAIPADMLMREAADNIAFYRSRVERLEAALHTIADFAPGHGDVCEIIASRARKALLAEAP